MRADEDRVCRAERGFVYGTAKGGRACTDFFQKREIEPAEEICQVCASKREKADPDPKFYYRGISLSQSTVLLITQTSAACVRSKARA